MSSICILLRRQKMTLCRRRNDEIFSFPHLIRINSHVQSGSVRWTNTDLPNLHQIKTELLLVLHLFWLMGVEGKGGLKQQQTHKISFDGAFSHSLSLIAFPCWKGTILFPFQEKGSYRTHWSSMYHSLIQNTKAQLTVHLCCRWRRKTLRKEESYWNGGS